MLLKYFVYKHLIFANSFAHAAAENLGILGSFFCLFFPAGSVVWLGVSHKDINRQRRFCYVERVLNGNL
jgi:hypothetical protein